METNEYKCFYIPKSKGYRKIVTYCSHDSALYQMHLDAVKSLNQHLKQSVFTKAYVKNRSIITNAKAHLYNDIFICLDVQDFFQSLNHNRLITTLYHEINRHSKKHFTLNQCESLVKSCSLSDRGIAVGLIPSPSLANIYLKEFDVKLYAWLAKQELDHVIYTRYADDITISFRSPNKSVDEITAPLIAHVARALRTYGLKLNHKKTRVINLNISNHIRITGINLIKDENNYRKLSVGRKRKDKLFGDALDAIKQPKDDKFIEKIKGMQSFVLSVEGPAYENVYSENMRAEVRKAGFQSLKELIDSL